MATGYRLFLDTGTAGPTVGDGISDSQTYVFDPTRLKPVKGAYVSYPTTGSEIAGQIYYTNGGYYFVPNQSYDLPAGESGTISAVQVPHYLTSGTDSYTGTAGGDLIYGGATTNASGTGNDTINAGAGDDQVYAGDGNDLVHGGDGDDTIGSFATSRAGNDYLYGDAGNDTVIGGTGDDHIYGGTGDDVLSGDLGTDWIYGEDGADTFLITDDHQVDHIYGGEGGTDYDAIAFANWISAAGVTITFSAAEAGTYDYIGTNTWGTFTEIEAIYGTGHADIINASATTTGEELFGGGGADVITGGSGADFLWGGADADTFFFNDRFGSDVVVGGEDISTGIDFDLLDFSGLSAGVSVDFAGDEAGSVTGGGSTLSFSEIEGMVLTDYADVFSAGVDSAGQVVDGGGGDDVIWGGTGADTFYGGTGADRIYGEGGDDTLYGGGGDDRLAGGTGHDTLSGGAGADTYAFADGDGFDVVTDFDMTDTDLDGFTNDRLDVSALTDAQGNPVNVRDVTVGDDGAGNAVLTFPDGTSVQLVGVDPASLDIPTLYSMGIACFAAGTLIATPGGARPVEALRPGDLLRTQGGAPQRVVWAARQVLRSDTLALRPELRPIRIRAGALGNARDLLVSPQHRMVLGGGFVPARWLAEAADGRFRVARGKRSVTYVHLMLPRHAVILAEGAPAESFYPGPGALAGLDSFAKAALFRRHPALAGVVTRADTERLYGPLALPELTRAALAAALAAGADAPPIARRAMI